MRKVFRTATILTVLLALSLVFTTSSALALTLEQWEKDVKTLGIEDGGTIAWDLDYVVGLEGYDVKVMERLLGPNDDDDNAPDDQTGTVAIEPGESMIWISDEAAGGDLTMEATDWAVILKAVDTAGTNVRVSIGSWDADVEGGYFDEARGRTVVLTVGYSKLIAIDYVPSFTVQKGDYLALEVSVDRQGGSTVTIATDGNSGVWYGPGEPEWPIPETATVGLLGGGLLVLGGVIIWKRRKASLTA